MAVKRMGIDEAKRFLMEGRVVTIPLERPELLERLKDEVYARIGPIAVSIDVRRECYRVQRDSKLPKRLWY